MELKLARVGAFWDEDNNRWYVEMDGDTVCHGLQERPAKHLRDVLIGLRSELAEVKRCRDNAEAALEAANAKIARIAKEGPKE